MESKLKESNKREKHKDTRSMKIDKEVDEQDVFEHKPRQRRSRESQQFTDKAKIKMHEAKNNKQRIKDDEVDDSPSESEEKSGALKWLDPDWSIVRTIKNWWNKSDDN